MDWQGKKIFVTGAGGFIGSWVAMELVARGADVTILLLDGKEQGHKLAGIEGSVNAVIGDLRKNKLIENIIKKNSIETVFHLAAQPLVRLASQSPLGTFETNIMGTWNLLEACRLCETVEGIIVASSDKAYGEQKSLPYTEESPLLANYPYDASKACADILARSYAASYGLNVGVTRLANVYGRGDLNWSRIVPDSMRCVINRKRLEIRSDGTPERDYLYIKDAVSGYMLLAENLHRKDVAGRAFNFGTGKPVSVLGLYKKITEAAGAGYMEPRILGRATNEISRQYLSSSLAERVLGWKPKHTLEKGLRETYLWYRDYFQGRQAAKEGKMDI